MTRKIKGQTVTLLLPIEIGRDVLDEPVYSWDNEVEIQNVLIAPSSDLEITEAFDLYGAKAVYTLGIPKTDSHEWEGARVRFFDKTWHVIGKPTKGMDAMIPLDWNLKVRVESYHENGQ